ncbi:MAG: sulfatase-like hydrolase/transferase [Planctomycetota bacterium]
MSLLIRSYVLWKGVVPSILCLAAASFATANKPNIIVIMADDMGYADAGFTGSNDILTPNLDQLAESGVVFARGYANHPFCGPTRAALLSGQYQHRFGFETNPAYDPSNPIMGIDPNVTLFPKRLQQAGYVTGCVGKWHLGAAEPFHPNNRGFDYFFGFLGGGHDYFRIDLTKPVKEAYLQGLVRNDKPAAFDGYLTTALSRDATSFITTNKDQPFFLYVAYNAPHAPLQAPADDIARYAHIGEWKRRIYATMVDVMDRGIGEIVKALEEQDLRDNTLIFFLSDNGGPQSSKQNPHKWNGSRNSPFRGGKGNLYDGGVHVPFVASWPAQLPAGKTYSSPVISLDISRTAVAVAGADAGTPGEMEGVNLIPFVKGQKQGPPHEALFWRGGDGTTWSVLTADNIKHLRDETSRNPQLFRLTEDPGEEQDLLADNTKLAKQLFAKWSTWNESNQSCRIPGYIDYHKIRDQFFLEAIPERATRSGYQPTIKGNFK